MISSQDLKLDPTKEKGVHSDGRKSVATHLSGLAHPNASSIKSVYQEGREELYTLK